jgi:hypothetical protein
MASPAPPPAPRRPISSAMDCAGSDRPTGRMRLTCSPSDCDAKSNCRIGSVSRPNMSDFAAVAPPNNPFKNSNILYLALSRWERACALRGGVMTNWHARAQATTPRR